MMMMMMKKRKELEGVNDDDHFSLSSSSPIKIRRLDAELPLEVHESDTFPQSMLPQPQEENIVVGHVGVGQSSVLINEPAYTNEDERAIVLFNPMNNTTPSLQSPAFSVSSNILSCLKNQILLANQSNLLKTSEDNAERQEKNFEGCLAVVPWVPSRLPPTQVSEVQQPDVSEMEAVDVELVSMDIEDNEIGIVQRPGTEFDGTSANEGLHHWQQ